MPIIRNDKGTIDYGLGDWCQIGALRDSDPWTPAEVTDTLNAIEFCRKSEKIFLILNQSGRAGEARALGDSLRQAARNNFVEWRYGDAYFCRPYCKTQTAQAMLIRNGIFEQEELPHAVDRMKEMLGGTENHMQVGVFGVQALLRVLCDYGMADVAGVYPYFCAGNEIRCFGRKNQIDESPFLGRYSGMVYQLYCRFTHQ